MDRPDSISIQKRNWLPRGFISRGTAWPPPTGTKAPHKFVRVSEQVDLACKTCGQAPAHPIHHV